MAIKAIYTEVRPDGTPLFALSPSDHEKIRLGYGCPNCLEDFTEGLVVTPYDRCPVCGHVLDHDHDFTEVPSYWLRDPSDPR